MFIYIYIIYPHLFFFLLVSLVYSLLYLLHKIILNFANFFLELFLMLSLFFNFIDHFLVTGLLPYSSIQDILYLCFQFDFNIALLVSKGKSSSNFAIFLPRVNYIQNIWFFLYKTLHPLPPSFAHLKWAKLKKEYLAYLTQTYIFSAYCLIADK